MGKKLGVKRLVLLGLSPPTSPPRVNSPSIDTRHLFANPYRIRALSDRTRGMGHGEKVYRQVFSWMRTSPWGHWEHSTRRWVGRACPEPPPSLLHAAGRWGCVQSARGVDHFNGDVGWGHVGRSGGHKGVTGPGYGNMEPASQSACSPTLQPPGGMTSTLPP